MTDHFRVSSTYARNRAVLPWLRYGFSFLSGYPERIRREIPMFVAPIYQALYDDSGVKGTGEWVAFGGIYAHAGKIIELAETWDRELRAAYPGRIGYFKLAEACNLSGEFQDWKPESRDLKVQRMAACLSQIRPLKVGAWFQWKRLKEVADTFAYLPPGPTGFSQPYFQLVLYVIAATIGEAQDRGVSRPLELIFDTHERFSRDVLAIFDQLELPKMHANEPSALRVLPQVPMFKDDKEFVALQAADLLAGELRLRASGEAGKYAFLRGKSLCTLPVSRHCRDITGDLAYMAHDVRGILRGLGFAV